MTALAYFTPTVAVKLGSSDLSSQQLSGLKRITVENELNVAGMAELEFDLDEGEDDSTKKGVNMKAFAVGTKISISLGFEKAEEIFQGQVAGVDPVFGSCSTFTVRAYDGLYRLQFGTHLRQFLKKTDSAIASQMAKESGLSASVENSGFELPSMLQFNITNYEFLSKRIKQLDFEMLMSKGKFHFRKPKEGASPVATLKYMDELDTFDAKLSVLKEGNKVTVFGWDVKKKTLFKGENTGAPSSAKMGGKETGFQVNGDYPKSELWLTDRTVPSNAAAKTLAGAASGDAINQFIEGEGELNLGDPKVVAGTNVKVTGVDDPFEGVYYVTQSNHTFDFDDGYRTHFKFRRTGI